MREPGMALDALKQNVAKYNDDRTGFSVDSSELVEDQYAPGVYTLPKNSDKMGFNEMKADNPKDKYNHYFKT